MTFVAAPIAAVVAGPDDLIAGDGWYPSLSIAAFRDAMRVGSMVTDGRVRAALIGAVVSASVPMMKSAVALRLAGVAALEDAPAPIGAPATIGGEARALVLWRRAVYAFAAADLADTHSDISATDNGRQQREVRATATEQLRRDATVAIRDLLGLGRAKVRLI